MANDPHWNNVVLAMHMDDAGLTDLKGHAVTLNGSAARSSAQSMFGGYSAVVGGATTANNISSPASMDWVMGSGPLTIEFWMYQTAFNGGGQGDILAASGGAFAFNGTTGMHWYVFGTASGVGFQFWTGTGGSQIVMSVPLSGWHHIAFTHDGVNTARGFVDGVLTNSVTATYGSPTTTPSIAIGAYPGRAPGATYAFSGYIDDLRITKGVARYTATFPAPTEAFPNTPPQISGTVKDSTGAFAARTVRAYRRSDGILTGSTTSNGTTGAFTVNAYDGTPHFTTAFDSGAENALIFDNITPV